MISTSIYRVKEVDKRACKFPLESNVNSILHNRLPHKNSVKFRIRVNIKVWLSESFTSDAAAAPIPCSYGALFWCAILNTVLRLTHHLYLSNILQFLQLYNDKKKNHLNFSSMQCRRFR